MIEIRKPDATLAKLLPPVSPRPGITYREDMDSVVSYIAGLREQGLYPNTLLD